MNLKHYDFRKLVVYIIILFIIESVILDLIKPMYEHLAETLEKIIDVSGLIGSLSLVYLFLIWYDRKLWKIFPSWLNLVSVPDLSGHYEGTLLSSHIDNGNRKQKKCEMEISQTASEIHVGITFFDSDGKPTESGSSSEQIIKNRNGSFTLVFIHHNKGNYNDPAFNMHRGLTELKYNSADKSFEGTYFNDPHRKTHGELKFKMKP